MSEMGFAWWIDPSEISTSRYFKFIPSSYNSDLSIPQITETKMLEKRILESADSIRLSDNSELLRLRELEKDAKLNDMILVINQCFQNSKYFYPPKTEELISQDILELANRILLVRNKLLQ